MARKTKVWGGLLMVRSARGQKRAIVVATSQRGAVEALERKGFRTSLNKLRNYWSETGNKRELAAAAGKPAGTVLLNMADNPYRDDGEWVELPDKGDG